MLMPAALAHGQASDRRLAMGRAATHVRRTCEDLVMSLCCLDSPQLRLSVAQPLLVSIHATIEDERGWLRRGATGLEAPAGTLARYEACLLRLDAVVLTIVAGDDWHQAPLRGGAIARLREATLEVMAACRWAC